jgi:hypothetical protein
MRAGADRHKDQDKEMENMRVSDRRLTGAVIAGVAVLFGGCSNPASPGQHLRAEGVVIQHGANTLVRAQGATVTGGLALTVGEQRGPLTVVLLDRNGADIVPPQGYYLRVTSAASNVAQWSQATAGEFGGTLTGVGPGQTTLTFCLMHGAVGGGHADGCQDVPVVVVATEA